MLGPVVSTLEKAGPSLERLSDLEAQLQEVAGLKAQMAAVLEAVTGGDKSQVNPCSNIAAKLTVAFEVSTDLVSLRALAVCLLMKSLPLLMLRRRQYTPCPCPQSVCVCCHHRSTRFRPRSRPCLGR